MRVRCGCRKLYALYFIPHYTLYRLGIASALWNNIVISRHVPFCILGFWRGWHASFNRYKLAAREGGAEAKRGEAAGVTSLSLSLFGGSGGTRRDGSPSAACCSAAAGCRAVEGREHRAARQIRIGWMHTVHPCQSCLVVSSPLLSCRPFCTMPRSALQMARELLVRAARRAEAPGRSSGRGFRLHCRMARWVSA